MKTVRDMSGKRCRFYYKGKLYRNAGPVFLHRVGEGCRVRAYYISWRHTLEYADLPADGIVTKVIEKCSKCGHNRSRHESVIINGKIKTRCICVHGRYPNRNACSCKRFWKTK